jgi:hypothetical protein
MAPSEWTARMATGQTILAAPTTARAAAGASTVLAAGHTVVAAAGRRRLLAAPLDTDVT